MLNDENFEEAVLTSSLPTLVDFWAPWCGPCKAMGPVIEEVAKELEGRAVVGKVNVDDHPQLAQSYNVLSIPTLVFFKGGKVVDQFVGALAKELLLEKMNALM